ncbi:TPA: hypothetical protein ACKR4E_006678, partial [Pseudomonas aeruginosa]
SNKPQKQMHSLRAFGKSSKKEPKRFMLLTGKPENCIVINLKLDILLGLMLQKFMMVQMVAT